MDSPNTNIMSSGSLAEPDFDKAFTDWQKDQTPEGNAAILRRVDPIINKAIQTHVGKPNPILRSRARGMALKALATYNPKRSRIQTHLYNHLRGLKRVAGQQSHILKVPERVVLDRRALEMASQELLDELGRDPTDDELAQRTGFSFRRMQRIRGYHPGVSEGFLAGLPEGGLSPEVQNPESDTWMRVIYDDLGPRDKKIMEWTIGYNGRSVLSNQEIARKLNVTPGAVSQRKAMIQQMLDEEPELSPFR
jgi:hypothetical protein